MRNDCTNAAELCLQGSSILGQRFGLGTESTEVGGGRSEHNGTNWCEMRLARALRR